eukprot:1190279-Prorocentrum_minimum.AAC.3
MIKARRALSVSPYDPHLINWTPHFNVWRDCRSIIAIGEVFAEILSQCWSQVPLRRYFCIIT